MRQKKICIALLSAVALATSCVNNDYDLSNIDTTSTFEAKDLTIPIKLSSIMMKSIINLNEDGIVKEQPDGTYAAIKEGDFVSEKINIPSFSAAAPSISTMSATVHIETLDGGSKPLSRAEGTEIGKIRLPDNLQTEIKTSANNVTRDIVSLRTIELDGTNIKVSLSLTHLDEYLNTLRFEDVVLKLPKGLITDDAAYDAETGFYTFSKNTTGNTLEVELNIKGIDTTKGNIKLEDGTFTLNDDCKLLGGKVSLYLEDIKPGISITNIPSEFTLTCKPEMGGIKVNSFNGELQHRIDDITFSAVSLKDMPDMLTSEGTNVLIDNPQIYINIANYPVQKYGIETKTSLQITAQRDNGKNRQFTSEEVTIMPNSPNYVLAPKPNEAKHEGYDNAVPVVFNNLGSLLGDKNEAIGMPQSLDLTVKSPLIYPQMVSGFKLGETLDPIKGKYLFYAPISLTTGTNVAYVGSEEGWNDKDLDKLEIATLSIDADVTTDIPMPLELVINPIVMQGGNSVIDKNIEGSARVEANAKGQHITVTLNGKITHLDGVRYKVALKDGEGMLNANQTIKLDNIKAKVNASFTKEL